MAFITEHDALVTEKQGGLLRVNLQTGERVSISALPSDLVNTPAEGVLSDNAGLFDVALHPEFASNGWIYITYSAGNDAGTTTKFIRARLVEDTLKDIEELFVATPYTPDERYHYGGGIAFGPDGKVYLTVGERLYNEADQPADPIAQDLCDRRGKIYRFNDDGSIPDDNPIFPECAAEGLFAIGIRASQGITTHPATGSIWFSEHGTTQGDEINLLRPGANYGWPTKTTGGYRYEEYQPPEYADRVFADPKWAWLQTVAPTGLDFYQGDKFPEWQGDLIIAGLSRGSVWRVVLDGEEIKSLEELLVNQRARIRDVAVSPGGDVYLVSDLMFATGPDGDLQYSGGPAGQIVRLDR